jgi:signal peptidase I
MKHGLWLFLIGLSTIALVEANEAKTAIATASPETRRTTRIAPGSALTRVQAEAAASEIQRMVPGTQVYEVRPTGSMRPLFDGNCLLLTEPAPFLTLEIGDIVIFRHSRTGLNVVHRILERRRDGYWTKGDYNNSMDDDLVTAKNYESRIFGIIYMARSDLQVTPNTERSLSASFPLVK